LSHLRRAPIDENPPIRFVPAIVSSIPPLSTGLAGELFRTEPLGRRALRFSLVAAAHVALLGAAAELAGRPEVRQVAQEIMVRLVEPQAPRALPPEPPPPRPQPAPRSRPADLPQPVMTAAAEAPSARASFSVAPQPPAPPSPAPIEVAPQPAPPVMTAARFDADYLANPKPAYPVASRRLGEEGKVVLRVHVGAEGAPLAVEIKHSCGFSRLDEAAKAAVERWRFVPARRGGEAIDSWVSVPIVFSLLLS
jgi:protein TonB